MLPKEHRKVEGDSECKPNRTVRRDPQSHMQAQTPPLSSEGTDPDKEKAAKEVPTIVESKRFMGRLSFIHPRRRYRMDSVNNVQESRQLRRKLSQMIKVAITKSRKVFPIHTRKTCL